MLVNYSFVLCLFCMYFLFSSRTKKSPVSCVLCPLGESQNRNYARAKSVTPLYIVLFSLDTKLGQEYLQDRGVVHGGAGGAMAPQILADHLTLSQPGGARLCMPIK